MSSDTLAKTPAVAGYFPSDAVLPGPWRTLKGTSIVSVIAGDLFHSVRLVYHRTHQVIPLLMATTMERHYARGTGSGSTR